MGYHTAEDLIERSIRQNQTVTVAYTGTLHCDLWRECEDEVENFPVHEYWGTENGSTWRVHLRHQTDDLFDEEGVHWREGIRRGCQ